MISTTRETAKRVLGAIAAEAHPDDNLAKLLTATIPPNISGSSRTAWMEERRKILIKNGYKQIKGGNWEYQNPGQLSLFDG